MMAQSTRGGDSQSQLSSTVLLNYNNYTTGPRTYTIYVKTEDDGKVMNHIVTVFCLVAILKAVLGEFSHSDFFTLVRRRIDSSTAGVELGPYSRFLFRLTWHRRRFQGTPTSISNRLWAMSLLRLRRLPYHPPISFSMEPML